MARRRPRPATEAQAPSPAFSEEALTLELEPGLIPEAFTWSRRKGEKVKVGTEIAQVKCSMKGKTGTKVKKLVASRTGTIESLEEPKLGEEPPEFGCRESVEDRIDGRIDRNHEHYHPDTHFI